jgi:hypothetical protein
MTTYPIKRQWTEVVNGEPVIMVEFEVTPGVAANLAPDGAYSKGPDGEMVIDSAGPYVSDAVNGTTVRASIPMTYAKFETEQSPAPEEPKAATSDLPKS